MHQRIAWIGVLSWASAGLAGCASAGPQVPASGARVRFIDIERSVEISLASESIDLHRRQRERGSLPRGLKLVPDEEMADLLDYLRQRRFFEYALEISPENPDLKGRTKALLVLETKERTWTFPFASNPGRDPAIGARVQSFVDIKRRVNELFNTTPQFSGVR
jgi:hypothetical protein